MGTRRDSTTDVAVTVSSGILGITADYADYADGFDVTQLIAAIAPSSALDRPGGEAAA
jgi:hypothetical protein